MLKKIKEKYATADNTIDAIVDVGLLIFDILSSPILIVMRIVRHYIKKWIKQFIKTFLKKLYRKVYQEK